MIGIDSYCNDLKEQVKQALNGRLLVDYGEDDNVYQDSSEGDCKKFILEAFDSVVFQLFQINDGANTLEKIIYDVSDISEADVLKKYMKLIGTRANSYENYKFGIPGIDYDEENV